MTPDWLDPIMKYIVVPLAVWNWRLHTRQNSGHTRQEVFEAKMEALEKTQTESQRSNSQRFDAIMTKLDSIEQALRK